MNQSLSLKLGQMFFVGIEGYTLKKEDISFLRAVQPGGVILFEHNIQSKAQVKKLIKDIKKHINITPFITCDHEGGQVERLRKICTSVPSLWALAKTGEKELLQIQKILALELLDLGFNMTLAPVLDINTNPKNPIINTRALSNNPKVVSDYGAKITELYLKNNLIPVGKHFPGHGSLSVDSHFALPLLTKSKTELHRLEFVPFKKVIKKRIPALMVSHIGLPKIEKDKKRPASISKTLISNILKKELHFKGLVITDDLTMKGITKFYSVEKAAKEAILAGVDMVLLNIKEKESHKIFESLLKELNKNKILRKNTEESYKRIINTKEKYIKQKKVNISGNKYTAYQITKKTVYWIKKDLFFSPLNKTDSIEIIYPISPKLELSSLKAILKRLKLSKTSLISYTLNPNEKEITSILRKLKRNTRKVLITYNALCWKRQKKLIKQLTDNHPDSLLISVGLENDIEVTPNIKNFIAAYAPNYISLLCAFEKLKTL